MKILFASFFALFLTTGSAFASEELLDTSDGVEIGSLAADTTENWGIDHDSYGRYEFKCIARPYNRGREWTPRFQGDGRSLHEAKQEALFRCFKKMHRPCYIEVCRKFKRHH